MVLLGDFFEGFILLSFSMRISIPSVCVGSVGKGGAH